MEKVRIQQFLEEVPALVSMCIEYVDYEEYDALADSRERLGETIKEIWSELPQYNFHSMRDEVVSQLDAYTKDEQRNRYVYSLITPFKEYSEAFYGKEIIRHSQEGIANLQEKNGADGMIAMLSKQIDEAEARSEKFFKIAHTADYQRDDVEAIFFELVNCYVHWYANAIDAALMMSQIDLDMVQEECGVSIKSFWTKDIKHRALEVEGYIGSAKLAESYLRVMLVEDDSTTQKAVKTTENQDLDDETFGITISQLFAEKDDCKKFFENGDGLTCAEWARRAWDYYKKSKLYFNVKGDKKTLYEAIQKRHPQIAKLGTFTHTFNELYKSTL